MFSVIVALECDDVSLWVNWLEGPSFLLLLFQLKMKMKMSWLCWILVYACCFVLLGRGNARYDHYYYQPKGPYGHYQPDCRKKPMGFYIKLCRLQNLKWESNSRLPFPNVMSHKYGKFPRKQRCDLKTSQESRIIWPCITCHIGDHNYTLHIYLF